MSTENNSELSMKSLEAELELSHSAVMPTPTTLDATQSAALTAAMAAVADYTAPPAADWEVLKFLTHHAYNVENAVAAYRKMRTWRVEEKIDTIIDEKIPQQRLIEMCAPSAFKGRDRDGRPLYFEKTGHVHTSELVGQVDPKQFERVHIRGMEQVHRMMEENSRELAAEGKAPVHELTAILDLKGVSAYHLRAMTVLQASTFIKDNYYPERLAKIFVVNAPWIFPTIFSSIKSWISVGIMSRTYVVHDLAELQEHIAPDQLPVEYGGTLDWTMPLSSSDDVRALLLNDPTVLTAQYINAGAEFTREIECKKGAEYMWNFAVDTGYDVNFSVECRVKGKEDQVIFIKPVSRCGQSKGAYTATDDCVITARFDNSFSYFNGKNLSYHCSAREAETSE